MTIEKLEGLLRLAREKGLRELDIDGPTGRVRAVFRSAPAPTAPPAAAPSRASTSNSDGPRPEDPSDAYEIRARRVGFFFSNYAGSKKALVAVGDEIDEGQKVGIIEVMKIKHEILADKKCRLVEVLVSDGSPVEYGQPLMRVRSV